MRAVRTTPHSTFDAMTERTLRPWGWYETASEFPGCKIKRIGVAPGQRISLQKHRHRREHWVVTRGVAEVTVGERRLELQVGQHCDIGQGEVHRLANHGPEALEIVELQLGELLNEDDIIRLQDDYGRP